MWKHCPYCDQSFALQSTLNKHLQSQHSPSAPTQDAYDAVCKALAHWRAEAARLGAIAGIKPRELSEKT